MRSRTALVAGVVLIALVAPLPAAHACSCGGESPRDALHRTDAAIVGVVLSRLDVERVGRGVDQVEWRVRVEESFKGKLAGHIAVRSDGPEEHTCGLRLDVGDRIGLFIDGIEGRLYANNCQKIEPEEMRRAAQPLPPPDGEGAPAFLAKTRGEHDLVALDAHGRVLRVADSEYEPGLFDVCPGGEWAAEIDVGYDPKRMRSYIAAGRRDVATLELHDVLRLERFEERGPQQRYVAGVWCRDTESKDVYVLARPSDLHGFTGEPGILARLHDGRFDVVAEEPIGDVVFVPTRSIAYLATGDRDRGYALHEFDLASGDRRKLAELKGPVSSLALNATASKIAGAEHSVEGPKIALFTYDLRTRVLRRSRRPRTEPVWVGDRIAAPHHTGQGLHVYDERLRLVVSKPGWKGGVVVRGDRIYGAWSGKVRSTAPARGPIREVSDVGLTLEPMDAAPVVSLDQRPAVTWTALGLIAFLVLLGAIIVRSRLARGT